MDISLMVLNPNTGHWSLLRVFHFLNSSSPFITITSRVIHDVNDDVDDDCDDKQEGKMILQ